MGCINSSQTIKIKPLETLKIEINNHILLGEESDDISLYSLESLETFKMSMEENDSITYY